MLQDFGIFKKLSENKIKYQDAISENFSLVQIEMEEANVVI